MEQNLNREAINKNLIKQDGIPLWLKIAAGEIGIKEIVGDGHNEKILQYHQSTTLKATSDEVSWCSAFACWCFEKAGISTHKSAQARRWLTWGEVLTEPKLGCVTVFWRTSPNSWQGHVAFYISEDNENIFVLGGNQNNEVCIKPYKKNQLLGYRWPK